MSNKKQNRNDPCLCGSGKKYKKCCLSDDRKNNSVQKTYNYAPNEKRYFFSKGFYEGASVRHGQLENDPRPNVEMLGDDNGKSYYRCGVCGREFDTEISGFFPEKCPECNVKFIMGDGMCMVSEDEYKNFCKDHNIHFTCGCKLCLN